MGPRREAELPRSIWHQPLAMVLAVVVGVAAGFGLNALEREPTAEASGLAAVAPTPSPPTDQVDPALLAQAQVLRDQAEALTAAEVELSEAAHEQWMPRIARIELARANPATPAAVREELDATVAALECVGVLAPAAGSAPPSNCVTLGR